MTLAAVCVVALVAVVLVSCVCEVNVGLLALTLAWVIGAYVAPAYGVDWSAKSVTALFPADLFLTLVGVTMLFTAVRANGTLGVVTRVAERACRSRPAVLGPLFFVLAATVSAAGGGNVPTTALLASTAMHAAVRTGVSPMLMMVMVGHGAIGGGLSPFTPMGVVADDRLTEMGLGGHAGYTFGMNLLANLMVAALGYLVFRGWETKLTPGAALPAVAAPAARQLAAAHALSLVAVTTVIVAAVAGDAHVGFAALAAATVLVVVGCAGEREVLGEMPWATILMVTGMGVLVSLCEKTGAIEVIGAWVASCARPATLTAWLAGITAFVSLFSSTSGVVLPTFLPMVPDVVRQTGQDPSAATLLAAATAVNVGSNVVDVSSVSTIGALCVAACGDETTRWRLYRGGLLWGLAMTAVGAGFCWAML